MTRDEIEKLCWRVTGWQADHRAVDDLLSALDRHVSEAGARWDVESRITEADVRSAYERGIQEGRRLARAERPPAGPVRGPSTKETGKRVTGAVRGAQPVRGGQAGTGGPRVCRVCGKGKPLSEFRQEKRGRGSVRKDCRKCENKARRDREMRRDHPQVRGVAADIRS